MSAHALVIYQIHAALVDLNESESWLAKRLGWTEERLSSRMTQRVGITMPELSEIAGTLGLDVPRLLSRRPLKWPSMPTTPEQWAKYERAITLAAEAFVDAREAHGAILRGGNAAE
jgi:hypothetical protein